ncbi:MAG: flavin monoamine oxidase family protein [Gaiellaceae bacterium]
MARTPLAGRIEEAVAGLAEERTTRRVLLQRGAALGAAAAGTSALARAARAANRVVTPKIVVVGGGLAGLVATYRLQQAGYLAELHEASSRLGGRCWTIRGAFADGQIAEHGGELIDSGHIDMKQLVQELGFQLDDLQQAEQNGTEMVGYFDGSPYTFAQMTDDLKQIWQQLHSDVSAASYPTLYYSSTQRGRELDAMSIIDWINAYVPGGMSSKLGQLLDVAYNIEYGAESSAQSSLNMLYLLGFVGPGQFRTFGKSNEKFHVRGGNDQVAAALASLVAPQVKTGSQLVAIKLNASGSSYTLTFQEGVKTATVAADIVVLALPFSIMRSSVDFSRAGFNSVKQIAIRELGMGTNSKLHVQFSRRLWRDQELNGETYSDTGYQNTWEVSRAQAGASGILVDYTGGTIGAGFGSGTPSSRAKQFLAQIEPVIPGATKAWNGKATIDFWAGYPWTLGSYSYWKVGQYTRLAGAEREQSGNCHFAGEHTSIDFQGYLQGAVESGGRAASEILADLKH